MLFLEDKQNRREGDRTGEKWVGWDTNRYYLSLAYNSCSALF